MPERKLTNEHAETAVLPEHLRPDRIGALAHAAAEDQGRYLEYVRSLDELPVLVDVVREPPRVAIKDFRLGQRPDGRKAPRDDGAALREQHARDIEQQYAEYAELCAGLAGAARAEPRKAAAKTTGRASLRQKKRAKRVKRSARSKS
jgi:hypothetical protein